MTTSLITFSKLYIESAIIGIIISLLGLFFIFSFIYETKREIVLSIIIWALLGICTDWLAIFFIGSLSSTNIVNVITDYNLLTVLASFLALAIKYSIVYFWFGKNTIEPIEKVFSFYQYIFFVLSMIVFINSILLFTFIKEKSKIGDSFYIYYFLCIIFLFLSVLYLLNRLIYIVKENAEVRILNEQIRVQQNFVDEINALIEHFNQLKHDYRHHLQYLYNKSLMLNEKVIDDYVKTIHNDHEELNLGFIENKNAISLLLMQKAKLAKKMAVSFECIVPNKLDTVIKDADLNVIFSNLLENAFEAIQYLETNKKISVNINTINDSLFINITNTFDGKISMWKNEYITRKNDKGLHGFGLKSVKRIVDNYDGMFKIDKTENEFKVTVALPI